MNHVNTSTGIIFFYFVLVQAKLNCTEPTPESLFNAFGKDLFPKQYIRPVKSFAHSTNVTLTITIEAILELKEKAQTLSLIIWELLEWDIEGLSWDETECGTDRVSVPRTTLWVPDIVIKEFIGKIEGPAAPYVYLDSKGHVQDNRPVTVIIVCQFYIFYFPFDFQNCSLTFGSFLHTVKDVRISEGITPGVILEESRRIMDKDGEWELINITAAQRVFDFQGASYSEIKYYIILRRKPNLYVVNLILPCGFLATVDLLSFFLPPQRVNRSLFKMTLILGYTVFLLHVNDLLPITGNSIPLINVFFSLSLALMVASLLETLLITNLQFTSIQSGPMPYWMQVLILHYLALVVCLPPQPKIRRVTVCLQQQHTGVNKDGVHLSVKNLQAVSEMKETADEDPLVSELTNVCRDVSTLRKQVDEYMQMIKYRKDWYMMGIILDRLLFGLYVIFIVVSFITIICIWSLNSSFSILTVGHQN